jgi:hypothetical protein
MPATGKPYRLVREPERGYCLLFPRQWDEHTPLDLIIHHHGAGELADGIFTDALKVSLVEDLVAEGWLVAAADAGGNNWGNDTALATYPELYRYISGRWPVRKTVAFSQSMGGLSGLLGVAEHRVPYRGWAGIYPVCNLRDMYDQGSECRESLVQAYGLAADGGDYGPKTLDHDPTLLPGAAFAGLPMRFYASPEDRVVGTAANSDRMAGLVRGHASECEVVLCQGDHGHPSHFQSSDLRAFIRRCLAG